MYAVECRGDWIRFRNRCYKAFNTPVSWVVAQENCRSEGGSLLTLDFEEHQYRMVVTGWCNVIVVLIQFYSRQAVQEIFFDIDFASTSQLRIEMQLRSLV